MQIYTNSIAKDWWAGDSFGQRRLVSSLFILIIGCTQLVYLVKKFFRERYQYVLVPYMLCSILIGMYLTLIHVYSWNYRQPHNIISWIFADPRPFIFDIFRATDKLNIFERIDSQYQSNDLIEIQAGNLSNEIQIPLPKNLVVGCKYAVGVDYKTTGNAVPVAIVVQTPYQPTNIPLSFSFASSKLWKEKTIFFVPQQEVPNPILILRNQSTEGTLSIKKVHFTQRILDISANCRGHRFPVPYVINGSRLIRDDIR